MSDKLFSVSVVVCTRNRGAQIDGTISSILAATSHFDELIVIDQSSDDKTKEVVLAYGHDARLKYLKTDTVGVGIARNLGLELAVSEIVACTDDDCTVAPDWLNAYVKTFRDYPDVVLAYGTVLAAEHDQAKGYIPAYTLDADRYVRNCNDKRLARGIGANMAMRRTDVLSLGGFDPTLGPGGKFSCCEEGDLTVRALLAGKEVYECKDSAVVHFGFRDWEAGRKHTTRDWIGIGAACAKPLRCGRWEAWPVVIEEGIDRALMPFIKALVHRRPPLGWKRVDGFVKGFAVGLRTPVDPVTMHFRPAPDKP